MLKTKRSLKINRIRKRQLQQLLIELLDRLLSAQPIALKEKDL